MQDSEDDWETGELAACISLEDVEDWTWDAEARAVPAAPPLTCTHGSLGQWAAAEQQLGSEEDLKTSTQKSLRNALKLLDAGQGSASDSDGDWESICREAMQNVRDEDDRQGRSGVAGSYSGRQRRGSPLRRLHPQRARSATARSDILENAKPDGLLGPLEASSDCSLHNGSKMLEEQARLCRDVPSVNMNICVHCGAVVTNAVDFARYHGVFFRCEMAGLNCEQLDADDEQQRFVLCCTICGEPRVLAIDIPELGIDFECALAGYTCSQVAHDRAGGGVLDAISAGENQADDNEEKLPVQHCSMCGAGYRTQLDLAGLGIDFQCSLLGRKCWDAECELRRHTEEELEIDDAGVDRKAITLSLVESQRLLTKFGVKCSGSRRKLEPGEIKKSMSLQHKEIQERYRNGQVVTTRGERFIATGATKASMGQGTELAGIIGSGARGRLGLGLKKMTKEDAEKYSLSNKERGHLKKKVAHAKNEREIVCFETKQNMHQLTHAAVLPASAVRPGR